MCNIDFSIIIPQRKSLDSLPRLFKSIPVSDKIEVLLIDNSPEPISGKDVQTIHPFQLLHSNPHSFAGGARNIGLDNAHGKWLIFADADDFFTPQAFDIFYSHFADEEDLIYFKSDSVYDDTLEPSDRNSLFNAYIDDYVLGKIGEMEVRLSYLVPWGKMIKRELVVQYNIRFDEVLAANDVYFSTLVGYYSKKIAIDTHEVYVITTRKGSLANRWDLPVIESRYHVALRRNLFLKKHGLKQNQGSVMFFIYKSISFGPSVFFSFLFAALRYHQNIFIGFKDWFKTYRKLSVNNRKNKAYIKK